MCFHYRQTCCENLADMGVRGKSRRHSQISTVYVIPTYSRWRRTVDVNPRASEEWHELPFILTHTLRVLFQQGVAVGDVHFQHEDFCCRLPRF